MKWAAVVKWMHKQCVGNTSQQLFTFQIMDLTTQTLTVVDPLGENPTILKKLLSMW